MNKFEYHIKDNHGERIASFKCEFDRDLCFDALCDNFSDCEFTKEDT